MTLERYIRIIAGSFVPISLLLAHFASLYWPRTDVRGWLLFTAFVGANLLQAGITRWCLMGDILKKFGVGGACGAK
jgi:hypothetical protein